jgi:hypothetical protein
MAHNNTVLAQLLKLIDRHDFQTLENGQFRPQRTYRALSRWGQFTTMMFAQITGRASLRDISASLQAQAGRLYHLGLKPVKKSTLADANNNRNAEFFQAFFEKTYQRCAAIAPGKKSFGSKTSSIRLMPPPSIFVCRFFPGPGFVPPKAASSCMPSLITMAIFRNSPVSPMPRLQILPLREH